MLPKFGGNSELFSFLIILHLLQNSSTYRNCAAIPYIGLFFDHKLHREVLEVTRYVVGSILLTIYFFLAYYDIFWCILTCFDVFWHRFFECIFDVFLTYFEIFDVFWHILMSFDIFDVFSLLTYFDGSWHTLT